MRNQRPRGLIIQDVWSLRKCSSLPPPPQKKRKRSIWAQYKHPRIHLHVLVTMVWAGAPQPLVLYQLAAWKQKTWDRNGEERCRRFSQGQLWLQPLTKNTKPNKAWEFTHRQTASKQLFAREDSEHWFRNGLPTARLQTMKRLFPQAEFRKGVGGWGNYPSDFLDGFGFSWLWMGLMFSRVSTQPLFHRVCCLICVYSLSTHGQGWKQHSTTS